MPSRVPAVLAHPSVVRAAVGPPAIALTAAGAGIGLLDHSLSVAVLLAIVGWGGRMGWAVLGRARRQRPVKPAPVDPWSVPPPWRDHLKAVVDAERRFDLAVSSLEEGPTRERVGSLSERIDRSVRTAAVTARRGALLTTPERAARKAALSAELAGLAQRHDGLDAATLRHESVVATELRAVRRADSVSAEALDQVRLLAARIDDAVAALVELSMDASDLDPFDGQRSSLPAVLDEIAALHAGMETSEAAMKSVTGVGELPPAGPAGHSATPDAPATS
ncbi:MAG: hypothetical protein M3063_01640 [Actinomycetota bacterium]|nr:hypothetical protein [Actinomycetota bacterium]